MSLENVFLKRDGEGGTIIERYRKDLLRDTYSTLPELISRPNHRLVKRRNAERWKPPNDLILIISPKINAVTQLINRVPPLLVGTRKFKELRSNSIFLLVPRIPFFFVFTTLLIFRHSVVANH